MDDDLLQASTKIQNLFIEYFKYVTFVAISNQLLRSFIYRSINQEHELVPFTGGSDYRPFLDAGVPGTSCSNIL